MENVNRSMKTFFKCNPLPTLLIRVRDIHFRFHIKSDLKSHHKSPQLLER